MSENKEVDVLIEENKEVKNKDGDKSASEEEENLIKEIYYLRTAIYKYEYDLKPPKFADIAESLPKCTLTSARENAFRIPDVPTILKTELYKYGGINCVKVGNEFVFQFPVIINKKVALYSVQIVNNNGQGCLGKWAMPESVDVNEIAKEHPLDDINNIRNFVKACKHYIDCYTYRRQQFYELKGHLSGMKNCSTETNMEYTRIILEMLGIKMISTGQMYDILLYIFYNPNEGMPCQMKLERRLDEDELDDNTKKMFQKYFKYFKKLNLKSAFEKIESNTSVFELKRIPKEEISIVDLEDEDDQLAVEFLKIIRKQNGGKAKTKKADRSHDILHEKDFSDENEEISDVSKLAERQRQDRSMSSGLVEPKKNKTTAIRNMEKGKTDKVRGIPKKPAAKIEGKRKSLGEKQQTLNFTRTSKPIRDNAHRTTSNRRQTVHAINSFADKTRETNNNTPIKNFSHPSKRSEDITKAPEVSKKSVVMENGILRVVENPAASNSPQKKAKKSGSVIHALRKSLNVLKNHNNPNVDENKKRKSVRWQVDPVNLKNFQTVTQNTAEGSNNLMNSTPLTDALWNCSDIRPSFGHISEIVRNGKTLGDVPVANSEQEDAGEKCTASDSGESENAEDQAALLRDLQMIKEMRAPDNKSKKKVQASNDKSRGKKSIKMKKKEI